MTMKHKRRHSRDSSYSPSSRKRSKKHNEKKQEAPYSSYDSEDEEDRKEGHYMLRVGDVFNSRYKVCGVLGKGTFGKVVEAFDEKEQKHVAIKVVRDVEKYRKEAQIEINILKTVSSKMPADQKHFPIVALYDWFEHGGHCCLVFEKLGPTLYQSLKAAKHMARATAASAGNGRSGHHSAGYFSLPDIQQFAKDMFVAIEFMHGIGLSHTDLKPENILFSEPCEEDKLPNSRHVSIIDFGGATFEDEHHSSIVCTRQYRPAEVTLGIGWEHSVDMWSVGCILAELFTGKVLFCTHDDVEHFALMERMLGTLPRQLVREASSKMRNKYFSRGWLLWPECAMDKESVEHVRETPRLKDVLARNSKWTPLHEAFYDLLRKLLEYDPDHRFTAKQALGHPFVTGAGLSGPGPAAETAHTADRNH